MSLASLDFAFSGLLVDARLKLFDLELARLRQLADTPAPTISAGALPPEADLHQLRELEQRQFEAERAQLQAQLTQLEQAAGDQAQEEQRLHQQLHHAHFTHAVLNSLVTAHESRLSTVGRPESVALEGACVRAAALLDQARQTHRDLASQVERETLAGQEEEANPQLIVQRTEKSVRRKQDRLQSLKREDDVWQQRCRLAQQLEAALTMSEKAIRILCIACEEKKARGTLAAATAAAGPSKKVSRR